MLQNNQKRCDCHKYINQIFYQTCSGVIISYMTTKNNNYLTTNSYIDYFELEDPGKTANAHNNIYVTTNNNNYQLCNH